MTLLENKLAMVEAHRKGDWETAKVLSQEKQRLKRKPHCSVCGVPVSKGGKNGTATRCGMHSIMRQFYSGALAASVALLCLTGCQTKPMPVQNTPTVAVAKAVAPMAALMPQTNVVVKLRAKSPESQAGTKVDVYWDAGGNAVSYRIYYSSMGNWYEGMTMQEVPGDATNVVLNLPRPDDQYYFSISAVDAEGRTSDERWSVDVTYHTPPAPVVEEHYYFTVQPQAAAHLSEAFTNWGPAIAVLTNDAIPNSLDFRLDIKRTDFTP